MSVATAERLDHPAPKLVAVRVVEPPDLVTGGVERALERALASVGYLPVRIRGAIPREQLPFAGWLEP
jgi:hypothetical protein